MTVLPYVTISIVVEPRLARRGRGEAARTARRRRAASALWLLALGVRDAVPAGVPAHADARRSSARRWSRRARPFNFVDLYIPSNPFHSLANGVVPAVVLFAVVLGVAMIGLERKQVLLDVLVGGERAGQPRDAFVVQLTPYGMFAIAANAAGTLQVEADRAHPGLPADLRGDLAARGAVGAARPRVHADADPLSRDRRRHARRPDHRVHGGRPVHRAADPHRGLQGPAREARAHRRAHQRRCRT